MKFNVEWPLPVGIRPHVLHTLNRFHDLTASGKLHIFNPVVTIGVCEQADTDEEWPIRHAFIIGAPEIPMIRSEAWRYLQDGVKERRSSVPDLKAMNIAISISPVVSMSEDMVTLHGLKMQVELLNAIWQGECVLNRETDRMSTPKWSQVLDFNTPRLVVPWPIFFN